VASTGCVPGDRIIHDDEHGVAGVGVFAEPREALIHREGRRVERDVRLRHVVVVDVVDRLEVALVGRPHAVFDTLHASIVRWSEPAVVTGG
jgi:hypothetical protein